MDRFDELGIPVDKRLYYFYEKDGRGEHWEGAYTTGGYMAIGVLGQTVHVLPQYNAAIVCLSERNSIEHLMVKELQVYPGLCWSAIEKEKYGKSDNPDDNDNEENNNC